MTNVKTFGKGKGRYTLPVFTEPGTRVVWIDARVHVPVFTDVKNVDREHRP